MGKRDPIMKILSVLSIVIGGALLAAVPLSPQWSAEKKVVLSLDRADARVGRPLTPGSLAGVNRRVNRRAYRGAYYGAAAAGAAAAYGVGSYYGSYGYPAYSSGSYGYPAYGSGSYGYPAYGSGYGYPAYGAGGYYRPGVRAARGVAIHRARRH
jgi:hypothetical protein